MRSITLICFIWATTVLAQAPNYVISTIAGANPTGDNGPARSARLYSPIGVVIDAQGVIYFCDRDNGRVRRVARDQTITTIAGGGDMVRVLDGQQATSALLVTPTGIALNPTANLLYFSDAGAHIVYSVDLATGVIASVAGNGLAGFFGDGGSGKQARLSSPQGLAWDSTLGLLIADRQNNRIRRIDPVTGVVSTFAGNGTAGFLGDGAIATAARLGLPYGVAVGPDRVVYIGDWLNSRIRRVKADGIIDTVAGTGSTRFTGDNGPALNATVDGYGVAVGPDGSVYLADQGFQRVRRFTPGGNITTIAGVGTYGFSGDGGVGTTAQFDGPSGITVDSIGTVYVSDRLNNRIRRITPSNGVIDTVIGRNRFGGDGGPAPSAQLTAAEGLSFDAAGNLYIADTGNHAIRRVGADGLMTTVAGVGGEAGLGGENISASLSRLDSPSSVVVDTDGTLYIADRRNYRVRAVSPAGIIRTISGGDDFGVETLALDTTRRRLYFTDSVFNQVLRIDLSNPGSLPVPIAGSPNWIPGFNGDGGPAISALVRAPRGLALAPNGDIYFIDALNFRIRRIDVTTGIITTVAGNGAIEVNATDGPVTSAILSLPSHLAIDAQGAIFLTESLHRIRRIAGGRIDTIAGPTEYGFGFSGDGGAATSARLNIPSAIAVSANGAITFSDTFNHRIRRLTPSTGPVPSVVSKLEIRSGNNQTANTGQLLPQALTVFAATTTNQPVAAVPVSFAVTSGTATLSAATVNTGSDGLASVTVTLGATAGPVQVTARSGSLTPVVFTLTATAIPTGPARPAISRGGIIGVGTSVPAVTTIAPRGIISIFGSNFLEAGVTGRRVDFNTEMVNGLLPTRLLGVCVEIGGTRAPMLDVFGTQLNVVVPAVTGPSVAVRVIRRCDLTDSATSDPETVNVAATAPEFLYFQLNADGRNPVAAVNAVSGALVGPSTLTGFVPAQSGDILTLYASGFGATSPAILPGGVSAGIANVTADFRVRIGTVDLAPADILYVGASPGSLIYQVNLRVPAGTPAGNLPVQIFLNGVASPANAYLAIAASTASDKHSMRGRGDLLPSHHENPVQPHFRRPEELLRTPGSQDR
jgi:uncharacterized protein (TIGR03437 family)